MLTANFDLRTTPDYRAGIWALSPDGSVVITANGAGARLWHRTIGMQFAELLHESDVTQLAFSPDSKYIGTVSSGAAIVWNAAQGKKKRAFAHPGIHQRSFSPYA